MTKPARVDTMSRRVVMGLLVLGLGLVSVVPAGATRIESAPHERVLYRADWSHGLAGWKTLGHGGWSVSHGALLYGGTGDSELVAPFRLPNSGDIAVEAQIESVRRASGRVADRGYGVLARSSGKPQSGVAGGFFYGDQIDTPQSGLLWDGDTLSGNDVSLHDGYNRFRLEIRGHEYTVRENGLSTVHVTIGDRSGTRLGLFSREYRIRVRSLVVVALPPSHTDGIVLTGSDRLPPLKRYNLTNADVPPSYARLYGHYYSNAEVARQRGVTTQSLDLLGRIMSYEVGYRWPGTHLYDDVYASIAVYGTTQSAHLDTKYIIGVYHRNSTSPAYAQSVPGLFGEEDDLSSYVTTAHDKSRYDVYDLVFRRGRYRVTMEGDFPLGAKPRSEALALLTHLAHVVDSRLQDAR